MEAEKRPLLSGGDGGGPQGVESPPQYEEPATLGELDVLFDNSRLLAMEVFSHAFYSCE